MKNIFFIIIFSFSFLNAIEINDNKINFEFNDFKIYYDENSSLQIEDAIKKKNKFIDTKKLNIGIKKYPVWTYGKIVNKSSSIRHLVFTNPRAGIDYIDIFILKDGKIKKYYELGDMNPLKNRDFSYRKSNFFLETSPNEEYEIFIKYKSYGSIDINWQIINDSQFTNNIKNESLHFGITIGFILMILLILLYLLAYFPSISSILYFFIVLGAICTQLSVAGIFYEMGINSYLNTIISWSFGNISASFIILFPIYYFKLKTVLKKTTYVLYFLSFSMIVLSISFLLYPFGNEVLYLAPVANLIFFIATLILLYVSIILYIKKINGFKIYSLANGLFVLSVIYFILGLLGYVPTNSLFYMSLAIGTFLNILFLGFLIFSNLLKLKKEKENAMILINEYSKLSSVGQSMINLSHQWKEPLNHIYYAINNVYAAREFKDPKFNSILDDSLKQIKDTATYMTNTGKNFLSLYEDKNYNEVIDLKTSIESVLIIFRKQIDELDIELNLELDTNIKFQTNKYLLANIFVAIIENTVKVFKNRKIQNPKLKIIAKKENQTIVVKITDNAGGIKEYPISSIFEKDFTNSSSTGLGLFLVKNILSLKLNGNINVENIDNGAKFEIKLKVNNI